eukprot:g1065.t1
MDGEEEDRRGSLIGDTHFDKTLPKISISDAEELAKKASKAKRDKRIVQKHYVAEELIHTEEKYVKSLRTLVDRYYRPLKSVIGTPKEILTFAELKKIFANVELLLPLNEELLKDLQKEGPDGDIGGVVHRFAPFLKMYHIYLDNADESGKAVRRRIMRDVSMMSLKPTTSGKKFDVRNAQKGLTFKAFCKNIFAETNEQLQSLLIKPVQRIPKYRLLLQDLLKNTLPNSADRANLEAALKSIKETASHVNESVRHKQERLEYMELHRRFQDLELPPEVRFGTRRIVHEGVLTKYDQNSGGASIFRQGHRSRNFFLFSDGLAYCDRSSISGQYSLKLWFPIFYLSVGEVLGMEQFIRISGVAIPPEMIAPLRKPGRRLSEEYDKNTLEGYQSSIMVECTKPREWMHAFRSAFKITGKISQVGNHIFFHALSHRALVKEESRARARSRNMSLSQAHLDSVVRDALQRLNAHRRLTQSEQVGAAVARPRRWNLNSLVAAPVSIEGFLNKLARVSQRNWKSRYFKLCAPFYTTKTILSELAESGTAPNSDEKKDSGGDERPILCAMLLYYGDMWSTKPKGWLRIGSSSSVRASVKGARENAFELTCEGGDRVYLQAESSDLVKRWKDAIEEVIRATVDANISTRVAELTEAETGSDRAVFLAREMLKQCDGLPSKLPPPPKGVFLTPESKASSLLATAKALQSRREFGAASMLFKKACQLSAHSNDLADSKSTALGVRPRGVGTRDAALGFRCLLCFAQCYSAWLRVALTVATRETGRPVGDAAHVSRIPGADGAPLVVITTDDTLRLAGIAEELFGSALIELASAMPQLRAKPREYPPRRIRRWIATTLHALGGLYAWVDEQEVHLALLRLSHNPPSKPKAAAVETNRILRKYTGRTLESLDTMRPDLENFFVGDATRKRSGSTFSSESIGKPDALKIPETTSSLNGADVLIKAISPIPRVEVAGFGPMSNDVGAQMWNYRHDVVFGSRLKRKPGSVSSWCDTMKDRLHPDAIRAVPASAQFNVFAEGVATYKRRGVEGSEGEKAFDSLRMLLEECDSVQGFHFTIDVDSAFCGFASELLLEVRDECPSTSRIVFGMLPSVRGDDERSHSSEYAKSVARRRLNIGFGCAALAETASLWCPTVVPERPPLAWSSAAQYVASALDTVTIPLHVDSVVGSMYSPVFRLGSVISALIPRPRMNVASLLMACPLTLGGSGGYGVPSTEPQLRDLLASSEFPSLRNLSPVDDLCATATATKQKEDVSTEFCLYGVLRGCAALDASSKRFVTARPSNALIETFQNALHRRCRRSRAAFVDETLRAADVSRTLETTRGVGEMSVSSATGGNLTAKHRDSAECGVSALACLSNSTAIHPFLEETALNFRAGSNRPMLAYFSEVGIDGDDVEAAEERLMDLKGAYAPNVSD